MEIEVDLQELAHVADVVAAPEGASMMDLAIRGGLDPALDFVGLDLRGWPLADQDLRGFDLSKADLRYTGIENANCDETTILDGARLDRRAQRLIGLVPVPIRRGRPKPSAYTLVRIPDLSDAELLERQFVIRDPRELPNVIDEAPPTDQWLTYEGRYEVGEFVICSFGHRHKKGYVFRDEKDRRYLVGNSCGAKHLGMSNWKEFAKHRELLEERASYLRDIRDLHDLFARNRDWIEHLTKNPAFSFFDRTSTVLREQHPELVRAVRDSSALGGRLFLTARERDFAAEEKIRERQVNAARETGMSIPSERPVRMKSVLKEAGILQGRSVFINGASLQAQLGILSRIVAAFLQRKPVLKREDLVTTTRNARTQIDKLFTALLAVTDLSAFFTPSNLILFVTWAQEGGYDRCSFSIEGDRLVISSPKGFTTTLAPPPKANFNSQELEDLANAAVAWRSSRRKLSGTRRPEDARAPFGSVSAPNGGKRGSGAPATSTARDTVY